MTHFRVTVLQGFLSLILLILEIHSTNVLDSGDAAFPQLVASPHSMDSVLQAGEGNCCTEAIIGSHALLAANPACTNVLHFCIENLLIS